MADSASAKVCATAWSKLHRGLNSVLQAREAGREAGPGTLAALMALTPNVPWVEVRNPTLYSLLPESTVGLRDATQHQEWMHSFNLPVAVAAVFGALTWLCCAALQHLPSCSTCVVCSQGVEQPINARASWLARKVVRGDALLTKIRVRPNEWRQPCMRWGSFDLSLYEVGQPFFHMSPACTSPSRPSRHEATDNYSPVACTQKLVCVIRSSLKQYCICLTGVGGVSDAVQRLRRGPEHAPAGSHPQAVPVSCLSRAL